MGCLTGRRIEAAFHDFLAGDPGAPDPPVTTVFEETSREIGGHAGAAFPPDPAHLVRSLRCHRPRVIVAFGRVADAGLALGDVGHLVRDVLRAAVVRAPHPAARGSDVPARLRAAAAEVRGILDAQDGREGGPAHGH